jgi:hypothetical protein
MKKIPSAIRTWKRSVAALGAMAGLALAPAPAKAQPCADLAGIPDDLLGIYFDSFESLVPLDTKSCQTMTKSFSSACSSAVKDAVKCWDRQLSNILKASKTACSAGSKNPSSCYDGFKTESDDAGNELDAEAGTANDECGANANSFMNVCDFGFP